MGADRQPIGYWLKHLDGLIEESVERALAFQGVTRRQWQTLNTLHQRPSTSAELAEVLRPFVGREPEAHRRVVGELMARGWVEPANGDRLRLTDSGSAAHATLFGLMQEIRRLLARGVTQEEYAATIDVLRRMAGNLESVVAESAGGSATAPTAL